MAYHESTITVLIVHDFASMRAALRMLVESHPDLSVAADVPDGPSALRTLTEGHADVLLLVTSTCDEEHVELVQTIRRTSPNTRVIVLPMDNDREFLQSLVLAGAVGVVTGEQRSQDLVQAIRKVHAGEVWLQRLMIASLLESIVRPVEKQSQDPEQAKIASLTERERQVIALVCSGLQNSDIARRLYLGSSTIRHRLTTIYKKLGVTSRLELAGYAYTHGLVTPGDANSISPSVSA